MQFDHQAIEGLCRQRGIRLLILFGSQATGKATEHSDTDLAVSLELAPSWEEFCLLAENIERVLHIRGRLDLVVLNTLSSTTLGREIVRSAKVLYDCDGEQYAAFATKAMKEYADFEPFRRLRQAVLARSRT